MDKLKINKDIRKFQNTLLLIKLKQFFKISFSIFHFS